MSVWFHRNAHEVRHDLERLNVQKIAKRGLNTSDKRTLNIYTWTVNTLIKNLLPLTHDIYSVSLMCNLWHFYKLLGEIWDKTLRYKSLETSWVIKLLKGDHKLWYVLIFLLLIQFCYYSNIEVKDIFNFNMLLTCGEWRMKLAWIVPSIA